MHLLRGLRRDQTWECLPELRRGFCAAPDPADYTMAARRVRHQASAVGQARAPQIQRGGYRGAFGENQKYFAGAAIEILTARSSNVIASESKQSRAAAQKLDCFVAYAPRNDENLSRRKYRRLDFADADAIAVALAPAAHHQRIAVFKKCAFGALGQLDRLGAIPAYFEQAAALMFLRAADGARPQEIADIHSAAGGGVVHQLLHR